MSDLMERDDAAVPSGTESEGQAQVLDALRQQYGISLLPTDLAAIQEMGFELLPQEGLARVSGALQQIPGLLHGQSLQNAYQETYAGAYRLLIPEGCGNAPKMDISRLTEEFGPDAESMIFMSPDGKIKRHGGVQKIDPPDVRAQQAAYLAFSAASVATSQYFLYRIDKKLETIESTTTEIIQFLESDKKNQLKGNYEALLDYYNRLHSIMEDNSLRQATLQQVAAIQRESMQAMSFYQEKVQQEYTLINEQLKRQVKKVLELLNKAKLSLSCYWLSVFVYEFSVTLEILLAQNTAGRSLKQIQQKIAEYEQFYQLYKELVPKYGKESGEAWLKAGFTAGMLSTFVPGIGIAAGAAIGVLQHLSDDIISNSIKKAEVSYTLPDQIQPERLTEIAGGIGELDKLYRGPIELAISGDQIYFRPINEEDAAAEGGQNG